MFRQFEGLCDRLLRAGIAPRHVRRYISELKNHLDDLASEERARGLSREAAEAEARTRLGSDETLAAALLARPGLRSLTARVPWLVFGFGPPVMLFAAAVAALFLQIGFLEWQDILEPRITPPEWIQILVVLWNGLVTYAGPLAVTAIVVAVGRRQRLSARWIAFGVVVACVLGGFFEIIMGWPDAEIARIPARLAGEMPGQGIAYFSLEFDPPPPILPSVLRSLIYLLLTSAACWYWLKPARLESVSA
jgi:cytochrome bd-type quinol oxidase subunit 1